MPRTVPIPSEHPEFSMNVDVVEDENERVEHELAVQTDKEELQDEEHGIAETLVELQETKEVILQASLERSLWEISEVNSSGVTPYPTIPPTIVMGIDAPVDPFLPPLVILLSSMDAPPETSPPKTQDESAPEAELIRGIFLYKHPRTIVTLH
uniref:Uncharacterized protein n=1 Tax=Solanum tuberosum TaxID=4113 RepID=M1DTV1_SOLTU